MLTIRRSEERGHANHGWLDSYHTFSFSGYYDPEFMGFRALRVINEDTVAGGMGFGAHGHNDMEIVTYVLSGGLAHKDSLGNGGVIRPGEVQHMSAGTGVRHSEYNASPTEPAHFLQIWVLPTERGITPVYAQKGFRIAEEPDWLHLLVSADGRDGSLKWATNAELFAARLTAGATVEHEFTNAARRHGWAQVAAGAVTVNGVPLQQGDGVAVAEEAAVRIEAGPDAAEVLLFELA